jgi:tRNA A37 methylthiotransferase MiaB
MDGQAKPEVRKVRSAALRAVFDESEQAFRQKFVGGRMPVLWESVTRVNDQVWQLQGLTDNYLRVTTVAPKSLWNEVSWVELTALEVDGLHGAIREQTF